ncbi:hypothetical protein EDD55_10427 [Varunaivibrio sulfuroxidans]|uniref:Uncharacterized protein n=2 Tax=Varunaivibrio sulfuroxidans TaxID=1773489 RepID=A0A4R3JAP9_9PROT|nr:hypothetical protein EDD55_10427 [Varunaivibrio sulfuroxidans]
MHETIETILEKMNALQADLEREFGKQREKFAFSIEKKKVRFEAEALARQRRLKQGMLHFWRHSRVSSFLTAPFIYGLILPIALLDGFTTVYQMVCFPVYGIAKVPREAFIAMDRHHLAYLNTVEKLNCLYCGYANGVIAYVREIASRTEQRWCPIKHARKIADPHARYARFSEFGDGEGYREGVRRRESGEGSAAPSDKDDENPL